MLVLTTQLDWGPPTAVVTTDGRGDKGPIRDLEQVAGPLWAPGSLSSSGGGVSTEREGGVCLQG